MSEVLPVSVANSRDSGSKTCWLTTGLHHRQRLRRTGVFLEIYWIPFFGTRYHGASLRIRRDVFLLEEVHRKDGLGGGPLK